MNDFSTIARTHILAIVRLERYDQAVEVVQALLAGGIQAIEFTLTGTGALEAIEHVRAQFTDQALIGAGTILTPANVQEVVAAGAQFIVTPVLNYQVIEACHLLQTPIICGALTPTEIQNAHEAGAQLIKVFPIRQYGPQYITDVLAPLPHVRLVPTGGVSLQSANDYLKAGAVAVAMGSNLVSEQVVAKHNWMHITRQAEACVKAIQP